MKEFKELVRYLSENRVSRTFLNQDKDHALVVLMEIFSQSQREIRIFAGSLCNDVGNDPGYIESISSFIEKGGCVKVLLNEYDDKRAIYSNLFKRLAFYVSEGKDISIKNTTSKPYFSNDTDKKEIHFTVGDIESYRIETNIEERMADCNLNNPEMAQVFVSFFDGIFENATEIDIKQLFNL